MCLLDALRRAVVQEAYAAFMPTDEIISIWFTSPPAVAGLLRPSAARNSTPQASSSAGRSEGRPRRQWFAHVTAVKEGRRRWFRRQQQRERDRREVTPSHHARGRASSPPKPTAMEIAFSSPCLLLLRTEEEELPSRPLR